jgi:formiminotetrahydrofolate cyclodeaminase
VLEACPEIIDLCLEVGSIGLQASRSDAGTGAQVARASAAGAYQNVCINMPGLSDRSRAAALLQRADVAWVRTQELHAKAEKEILGGLRAAAEQR